MIKRRHLLAAAHTDLAAKVFFGAGERERADPGLAAWGMVSSETLMAETVRLRKYPSAEVTPGEAQMELKGYRYAWTICSIVSGGHISGRDCGAGPRGACSDAASC